MPSTLHSLFIAFAALSLCQSTLGSLLDPDLLARDIPSRLERREQPTHKNSAPSSFAKQYGDPKLDCKAPSDPNWIIHLDPLPPGCYEEGQTVEVTWTIAERKLPKKSPPTPVFYLNLAYFASVQDVPFAPTLTPLDVVTINGHEEFKPLCVTDLKTTIRFPSHGVSNVSELYPKAPYPWTLIAHTWQTQESIIEAQGERLFINEAPDPFRFSKLNGFYFAAKGRCKGFKSIGSSGSSGATGLSTGLPQLGDSGLTCKLPDPLYWTINLHSVKPGCYEEGQSLELTWEIVKTDDLSQGSRSPILTFELVHFDKPHERRREKLRYSPAATPIDIDGNEQYKPVCATDLKTTIEMPPVGKLDASHLYPEHPVPWAVLADLWGLVGSDGGGPVKLTTAPPLDDLNNANGFFVAKKGGCKKFKTPK